MSDERFIVETVEITDCCADDSRIVKVITDKDELYSYNDLYEIKDQLNEQQATIQRLEEENDKLIQKNCIPCELVNLQTREIDKLKEENEQLREELNNLKKDETMLYHYYTLARYSGDGV